MNRTESRSKRPSLLWLPILFLLAAAAVNDEYLAPVLGTTGATSISDTGDLNSVGNYQCQTLIDLSHRQNIMISTTSSTTSGSMTFVVVRGYKNPQGTFLARSTVSSFVQPMSPNVPQNSRYACDSFSVDTGGYLWAMVSMRQITTGNFDSEWSIH